MVAALVWMAGVAMAWGQDYVTGDKYVLPSVIIDKTGTTANGNPMAIFDGDNDTWWAANQTGPVTITLTFKEDITFNGLSVYRSGNPAERATQIEILSSTTGADGTWSRKHLESNINRDGDRTLTFSTPSITARFIRLVFTPSYTTDWWGNRTYEKMAINEVRFTGVGSIRDELYIAGIQHKPAKWYDLRGSIDYGDTFDDKNESDKYYGPIDGFVAEQMQAAHTIIDTIYMHRGKSIELKVPDYLNNEVSSPSYQRWYSLRTGKTFATTKAAPVTDILTPKANNLYYRFSNGYVGAPITTASVDHYTMNFYMPTEEQFSDWFEESKNFDGNWYVIACDLSCYTDYTEKYDSETSPNSDFMQTFTEPTLSHRIIYYIRAVDENDEVNWYNKAWKKQSNTDFLEEYEINMPFTRYPDNRGDVKSPIYEMVALSKDARSYAEPGTDEAPSAVELTVSLDDKTNTAGIILQTYKLSGTDRAIFFDYPVSNTQEGTKSVKDVVNPMAEIIVKKGSKNLVKFTLNFTKGTSLMTQSMISQLEDEEKDLTNESWGAYRERTPKYLESNFEFLTGLDFDFREDVAKTFDDGEVKIYPFPLGWDDCSYGFYDGSTGKDMKGTNTVPQWGYYSIINAYLEASSKTDKNDWGWNDHIQTGDSPETSMENRKGEIYSKKVSTARVTDVNSESTRLFTISGRYASTKRGDVAVLKDRHRLSLSIAGQGSFGNDPRYGGRIQLEVLSGFSKAGIARYILADIDYNRYRREPENVWWNKDGMVQPTLQNASFSLGYGVGFNFLGRFEIMPYILAGYQMSFMTGLDEGQVWNHDTEQWETVMPTKKNKWMLGNSFITHGGIRLSINIWYPVQLIVGGDYNLTLGIRKGFEPATRQHELDRLNIYTGLRFHF